jgi:hypothetical protein
MALERLTFMKFQCRPKIFGLMKESGLARVDYSNFRKSIDVKDSLEVLIVVLTTSRRT